MNRGFGTGGGLVDSYLASSNPYLVTYDTPHGKIEDFLEGIRHILLTHPNTRKDNIQAVLYDSGPDSLNILLNFFLQVPDRAAELNKRQRVLLDILSLAEAKGICFAAPLET